MAYMMAYICVDLVFADESLDVVALHFEGLAVALHHVEGLAVVALHSSRVSR